MIEAIGIKRLVNERSILVAYLLSAFVGGLVLCRAVPPFGGLDEPWHWFRSQQVSRGVVFAPRLGPNDWGGAIDLHDIAFAYWFAEQFGHAPPVSKRDAQSLSRSLNAKPVELYSIGFPSTAAFPPTAYLPAAVSLFAARHMHLGPMAQVIVGRIGQLCSYLLLVGATVWALPAGRLVAAGLLTTPTLLHLASCFSADPANIAVSSLLIAWCLRLRVDPTASLRGWRAPALFSLVVLTGTLKIAYAPLSFFVVLCPLRCFPTRRIRLLFIVAALGICWAAALCWASFYDFIPGAYWHHGADPRAALAFIAAHPFLTANGIYETLHEGGWYLWRDMDVRFGGHAPPFSFFVPAPWAALDAAGLLAMVLVSGVAGRHRGTVLACWTGAIVIAALVLASFRVAYGRPEVSTIDGLQGRYFAVAVLLVLLGAAYALPPVLRAARLPVFAVVFCTHAVILASGATRYATLWR